jgi:hypothetical protein
MHRHEFTFSGHFHIAFPIVSKCMGYRMNHVGVAPSLSNDNLFQVPDL